MDDSNKNIEEKSVPKPNNLAVQTLDQPGNPGWSGFLFSPFYSAASLASEAPPPTPSPLMRHDPIANSEASILEEQQFELKAKSEEILRLKEVITKLEELKRAKKAKRRERKAQSNASANPELFSVRLTPPLQSVTSSIDIVEIMEIDDSAGHERCRALEDKLIAEKQGREKDKKESQELMQVDVEEILRLGGVIRKQEHQIELLERKLEESREISGKSLSAINSKRDAIENMLSRERDVLRREAQERELKSREEALAITLLEDEANGLRLAMQTLEQNRQAERTEKDRQVHEKALYELRIRYLQSEADRVGI